MGTQAEFNILLQQLLGAWCWCMTASPSLLINTVCCLARAFFSAFFFSQFVFPFCFLVPVLPAQCRQKAEPERPGPAEGTTAKAQPGDTHRAATLTPLLQLQVHGEAILSCAWPLTANNSCDSQRGWLTLSHTQSTVSNPTLSRNGSFAFPALTTHPGEIGAQD